jgi:N6-adenosine-specific RNA methylase IME4
VTRKIDTSDIPEVGTDWFRRAKPNEIMRAARAQLLAERRAKMALKKARREGRERDLTARITALPSERFGVILADPEWDWKPWSQSTGMDRAASNHYPTSSVEAIKARDVASIAANDCVLFLWATAPMLVEALDVMASWGFAYKSNLVWSKVRVGTGYWARSAHEHLLIGTRGSVPAPAMGDQARSIFEEVARGHSQKPEIAYEIIESYFPTVPKIELNARVARPGWTAWGTLEGVEAAAGL